VTLCSLKLQISGAILISMPILNATATFTLSVLVYLSDDNILCSVFLSTLRQKSYSPVAFYPTPRQV